MSTSRVVLARTTGCVRTPATRHADHLNQRTGPTRNTLSTNDDDRDGHVKSGDFPDVEYPGVSVAVSVARTGPCDPDRFDGGAVRWPGGSRPAIVRTVPVPG